MPILQSQIETCQYSAIRHKVQLIYDMTSIKSLLSGNIQRRRNVLGISQAILAERVGTSTHYIAQIEQQNRFPSPSMIERIATALEFDTPDLFLKAPFTDDALQEFKEGIISDIIAVNTSLDKRLDKLLKSTAGD